MFNLNFLSNSPLAAATCVLTLAFLSVRALAADEGDRDFPALGGPTIPDNQVEADRAERQLPEARFLQTWYDWKDRVSERNGFAVGFDYTAEALKGTENITGC